MASSDRHAAYGAATPASGLSQMILEGLQECAPGEDIDPVCIDIERQRHHVLRMDSSSWGRGWVVSWQDEAWGFCAVDYLRHVQGCGNTFHLEPVIKHDFDYNDIAKRTTLTFVSQKKFELERARHDVY